MRHLTRVLSAAALALAASSLPGRSDEIAGNATQVAEVNASAMELHVWLASRVTLVRKVALSHFIFFGI